MRLVTIFLLLLLLCTSVFATSNTTSDLENPVHMQTNGTSGNSMLLTCEINSDEILANCTEEIQINHFSPEEMNSLAGEMGVIPSYGRMIRLPLQGTGRIVIQESNFQVMTEEEFNTYAGIETAYTDLIAPYEHSDTWYPQDIVHLDEPAILKDFRVTTISTFPMQINPVRGEIRMYTDISAEVIFDQPNSDNILPVWPQTISEMFLPFYRQLLDWDENELDNYELYRGSVQVVVQNDNAILAILAPWIEWKEQKGYELQFLTDEDVTSWSNSSIKAELQERYDNAEIKFDHIVIIGDASGGIMVPPGAYGEGGSMHGSGDHVYGCLAGVDDIADVSIGRISVGSTNDLITYVNKVLSYELEPYTAELDWYRVGNVASGSASSGISTVFTCEYARELMLRTGYTDVHTAYYNDNGGDVNVRTIQNINNGVSFHLYRGIYGSGLEPSQILALNNAYMLPFVIDITCGRGNWADALSINEAYMRAGTPTQPCGGIGAMSTATSETHTRFNNALSGGGVYAAFVQQCPTLGEVLIGCKMNLWNNLHAYQSYYVESFNRWMNLMGDPTVWTWTDIPRSLFVTSETSINAGENGFEVVVTDQDGALENAWVTLYKSDSNEKVIARGVTDEDGRVLLEPLFNHDGLAVLTVTAKNAHPYRETITVTESSDHVGVTGIEILDDGTQGTTGNGNEIAEYNETIGLLLTLYNYGSATENNIQVTAVSDDPFVLSVSGTATLASLNPNTSQTLTVPLLVELNPNIPDQWQVELDITIHTNRGTYTGTNLLTVSSPRYTAVTATISDGFEPGGNGDITVIVANAGQSNGEQSTVTLSCNHEWVTVLQSNGTLPSVDAGSTSSTSTFRIHVNELAFRGYRAPAVLTVSMPNGREQSFPVHIPLGTLRDEDPFGPDNHGYFAIENTDTGYLLCPAYDWLEINPAVTGHVFDGTRLNLNDSGDDMDVAVVVDLPFDFTYYGQTYSEITVCSNGWIAMGEQTNLAQARNWTIPSPLGPFGMIAPYWDDRIIPYSGQDGGVYSYTSEAGDCIIIEWDRVKDRMYGSPCTFQVILYAQNETSPTPTGDNEFMFQYNHVEPSYGDWAGVPYWTTGIESPDESDGLQHSYYNIPSAGNTQIVDERVIFFTTRTSIATGTVVGTVTYSDDNSPIEGVIISTSGFGTSTITDDDGSFELLAVPGMNSLTFVRSGFETIIVQNINVIEGETVQADASMDRPALVIEPYSLHSQFEPGQSVTEYLDLNNSSTSSIGYETVIHYTSSGSGEHAVGEHMDEISLGLNAANQVFDILAHDDYLWVLLSQSYNDYQIRQYTMDGELLNAYPVNVAPYLSIEWYNDQFILVDTQNVLFYDYSETNGFQLAHSSHFNLPLEEDNEAWYDPSSEQIYICNLFNRIDVFSIDGSYIGYYDDLPYYIMDIEVVPDDPQGMIVHYLGFNEGPSGVEFTMSRLDPETSANETLFVLSTGWESIPERISIVSAQGEMYQTLYACHVNHDESDYGTVHTYRYIQMLDWIVLSEASGTVNAGETETLELSLEGTQLEAGDYSATLEIVAPELALRIEVPISVYVGINDINDPVVDMPQEWSIDSIWPNPFNPRATVQFSLPQPSPVRAVLYNVLGQEVLSVVNEPLSAGTHTVMIDGSSLASGLYFFHFEAGAFQSTRKIILLK